jgi:hypothetical protein
VKKALFVLALLTVVGAVGASQLIAAPPTFVVDQGTAQCASPNYTGSDGIQMAINAATAGDTIRVCAGAYDATTVSKDVTLNGPQSGLSVGRCRNETDTPAANVLKDAVVTGGFDVTADGVTISGFTVQGGAEGVSVGGARSGVLLSRNFAQDNAIGFYLNGDMNTVTQNCIRNNNAAGGSSGSGIYSDQNLSNSDIKSNIFVNNNNAGSGGGVNLPAGDLSGLTINNNQSFGDANFVAIQGARYSEIDHNLADGTAGGAIYLSGANDSLEIARNTLKNGGDDGIAFAGNGGANDQILVSDNTIGRNTSQGIDTSGPGPGLTDSLIGNNTVKGNGDAGILFRTAATQMGNFVYKNTVINNGAAPADNCKDLNGDNTFYGNNPECSP